MKNYYQKNKEHILSTMNVPKYCDICGKNIKKAYFNKHCSGKKHLENKKKLENLENMTDEIKKDKKLLKIIKKLDEIDLDKLNALLNIIS